MMQYHPIANSYGIVHILRKPPEGGGRGEKLITNLAFFVLENSQNLAYATCERSHIRLVSLIRSFISDNWLISLSFSPGFLVLNSFKIHRLFVNCISHLLRIYSIILLIWTIWNECNLIAAQLTLREEWRRKKEFAAFELGSSFCRCHWFRRKNEALGCNKTVQQTRVLCDIAFWMNDERVQRNLIRIAIWHSAIINVWIHPLVTHFQSDNARNWFPSILILRFSFETFSWLHPTKYWHIIHFQTHLVIESK